MIKRINPNTTLNQRPEVFKLVWILIKDVFIIIILIVVLLLEILVVKSLLIRLYWFLSTTSLIKIRFQFNKKTEIPLQRISSNPKAPLKPKPKLITPK
jgi:hypothetical protein